LNKPFSQEYLNAFVDGELAAEERVAAMARLEDDLEFKRAACEMRVLKDRVRAAYAETPGTVRSELRASRVWWPALAATLLLGIGLAGGWFAHAWSEPERSARVAGLPNGYRAISFVNAYDPDKIVLHLDSNAPQRFDKTLALAEGLLDRRGEQARIEIVVNGQGVDWLRSDITPYGERIEELARRHANLTFIACGQALSRLKREGTKVVLLPSAEVTTSAADEIFARLGQGWVYVKV
jgi:intracellular sulfur oxidation DsrE/DsrF family protein